jgi:hypothetical protein
MMVPLCRMVAMPIVRPTLSSDLASLEADFVHGYREGAVVFYLSTTNEGGVVEKVTDEDLQSWGSLWCAVNTRFEDYLSSVLELRHLKGVKFSVCDGNHRRQAWWNVISHLHSTDPSWYYMVDSIVVETQGKLGVVMLAMHDVNKYISSTCSYSSYSLMIEFDLNYVGSLLWPRDGFNCISCPRCLDTQRIRMSSKTLYTHCTRSKGMGRCQWRNFRVLSLQLKWINLSNTSH